MKMLERLRSATEELHREIEKDNLAAKIIDHSISLREYKLLLLQNYIAYKISEKEIEKHLPNWESDKSDRLEKDLEVLKVDTGIYKDFEPHFKVNSYAEALGAAYVLEGSALGGMQIGKALANCPALEELPSQHFFTPNREAMQGWNDFLKLIRNSEFSEEEKEAAALKAQETFKFFGLVFELSSVPSA